MWKDFKAFIARGNVLDLAIAVILAGAFGKIVTTFTEKMLMPVVGFLTGGIDFGSKFIDLSGKCTVIAQCEKGAPLIMYGQLITDIITFLIVAFIMFLLARWAVKFFAKFAAAAPPAGPTPSEELLTEIRDLLKARQV